MAVVVRDDHFPFMKLARELRDMIYDCSLTYNGVQQQVKTMKDKTARGNTLPCIEDEQSNFKTPAFLLVDKEVSSEALSRLRKKQLVIWCPPTLFEPGLEDLD